VIIVHGNGWLSLYGHLASFAVGNGQGVGRGQTIGYEGSTGNSTGPHLHFEIRLNDVPQNPLQYLP
jgi:murein DD-endopeptidase MepM/ murein hydrolase activator NlpD